MSNGEVDEARRLIASAFVDNPNTLAVTRGDRARAQRIMQAGVRVAKLGRKCSYVLVAEQAGRIVGVLNAAEWPNRGSDPQGPALGACYPGSRAVDRWQERNL